MVPANKVIASIAAVILVVFFFLLSCITHTQSLRQQRIQRLMHWVLKERKIYRSWCLISHAIIPIAAADDID